MESLTKNKQNRETISKMVEKYFSPLKMKNYRELTEGYFNIAYEIHLSNEEQVILKIAPLKEMRVMTYEKNIMFSEVEAMKLAIRHGKYLYLKCWGMMTVVPFAIHRISSWKS